MPQEEAIDGPKSDSISLLLVVEDDPTANRLAEVLARPDGIRYAITRVLRVEDALLRLQETPFDAMLLDLSVHEGPGLDSLMRASAATRSIPVVVLTYQRDEATVYEDVLMPVGYTHDPFCRVAGKNQWEYPWHRYYADTDSIWLAIELHPQA